MKRVSIEITEKDWTVLRKNQQVWKEVEGHIVIIREFKGEVPTKAIKG